MLDLNSQVKELKLYDNHIETSVAVSELISFFKSNPNLPGVIVWSNKKIIGVISQKIFWQYMSRPYSFELASRRSLKYLLDFVNIKDCLVISADLLIRKAAKESLERSAEQLDEPILVKITRQEYRLLDPHQLLVAYAQIHELTFSSMKEVNKKLESANQTLEQVLRLDPVTKLGTKSLLKEYLNREWKRAIKEKKWLSLIRLDLDYFQEYQELYSQLVADESLEKIGSVMKTIVKRSGDLTIHYGEGKFAILLPNSNVVDADRVAEEIREKIEKLEIVNLQSKINTYLTASLGVAGIKPALIEKQKALITRAEQALTQAKQSGRNRKAVWNNSYNEIHTVYEGINEIPTVLS